MKQRYTLVYTQEAKKDAKRIGKDAKLKEKVKVLLSILKEDPIAPPCKALVGRYKGTYSRRINIQHRLVYQILEEEKMVKVLRMWTHYGE